MTEARTQPHENAIRAVRGVHLADATKALEEVGVRPSRAQHYPYTIKTLEPAAVLIIARLAAPEDGRNSG